MKSSNVVFLFFCLSMMPGCSDQKRSNSGNEDEKALFSRIIDAIDRDLISPVNYENELLENRELAQAAFEVSSSFNKDAPVTIEEFLFHSYFRWELLEDAYRLADFLGDSDKKTLIEFMRGMDLEDRSRPLFQGITGGFEPESILKDYRDDMKSWKRVIEETEGYMVNFLRGEDEMGIPFPGSRSQGILYLLAFRAREKELCEFGDLLHKFGKFQFRAWGLAFKDEYRELPSRDFVPIREYRQFRTAALLSGYFEKCGMDVYADLWRNLAFDLHAVLEEEDDGYWYGARERHLYKIAVEEGSFN